MATTPTTPLTTPPLRTATWSAPTCLRRRSADSAEVTNRSLERKRKFNHNATKRDASRNRAAAAAVQENGLSILFVSRRKRIYLSTKMQKKRRSRRKRRNESNSPLVTELMTCLPNLYVCLCVLTPKKKILRIRNHYSWLATTTEPTPFLSCGDEISLFRPLISPTLRDFVPKPQSQLLVPFWRRRALKRPPTQWTETPV